MVLCPRPVENNDSIKNLYKKKYPFISSRRDISSGRNTPASHRTPCDNTLYPYHLVRKDTMKKTALHWVSLWKYSHIIKYKLYSHIRGKIHFTALTQESYWTNSSSNHKPLREQSDFQSYHIILFKIFSFQHNYEIYKEIVKKA